jgi:chaperonin GroES
MKLSIKSTTPSPVRIICEVIKPEVEAEKKTAGGIIIPGSSSENAACPPKTLARFISKGKKVETDLKKGDTVYYMPFGGQLFTLDETEYIILTEGEILAIFAE